jgi:hypothetical protein
LRLQGDRPPPAALDDARPKPALAPTDEVDCAKAHADPRWASVVRAPAQDSEGTETVVGHDLPPAFRPSDKLTISREGGMLPLPSNMRGSGSDVTGSVEVQL